MNFANPVTPAPIAAPLAARPPRRHVADRQRKGTGMTNVIHGIRNCDTMKKARTWLDSHGVAHRFHDYRADGIDPAMLEAWVRALGWEGSTIEPAALPEWLTVWRHEKGQARAAELRPWDRGPGAARPSLTNYIKIDQWAW